MDVYGFDEKTAASLVSLATKVRQRDGSFTISGLLRYGRDAYAQDPLLRLHMDGKLGTHEGGTGPSR
ncbi:hypothetical protein DMH12_36155 [Streptomyces sp. WAC 04229]|nr:hypothetical protein DMH12_36155 [Streptomyces sp. WAC 04229]